MSLCLSLCLCVCVFSCRLYRLRLQRGREPLLCWPMTPTLIDSPSPRGRRGSSLCRYLKLKKDYSAPFCIHFHNPLSPKLSKWSNQYPPYIFSACKLWCSKRFNHLFFFFLTFCSGCAWVTSPSVSLLCQQSVASVHWERVGSVARLVDVSLLETAKLWLCCCEKPLHAVKHRLLQDTACHRSQGRFPLRGKTLPCQASTKGKERGENLINTVIHIQIFFQIFRYFWIFRCFVKSSKHSRVS